MKRNTIRRLATALATITALTSLWSSDGWAQDIDEMKIWLGPHAEGGENQLNPENEWLHFDEDGSPTNRADGGTINYDYCQDKDFSETENHYILTLEIILQNEASEIQNLENQKCKGKIHVPWQNGVYQLNLLNPKTNTSITKSINYSSIWIAIIGDSYSSGEGAPQSIQFTTTGGTKGYWRRGGVSPSETRDCHRSSLAWGFQAALDVQKHWKLPIDVSLHACSGAKMLETPTHINESFTLTGHQNTIQKQLEVLQAQINTRNRKPDLVLMSIGGNDIGFGEMIEGCYKFSCNFTQDKLNLLVPRYMSLATTLNNMGINHKSVYISTYPSPDPSSYETLGFCGISKEEITIGTNTVAIPMNSYIRAAAIANGWNIIENENVFRGHGFCAKNSLIHTYTSSKSLQGDHNGTFHPSDLGHLKMSLAATEMLKLTNTKYDLESKIKYRAEKALEDSQEIAFESVKKDNTKIVHTPSKEGDYEITRIVSSNITVSLKNLLRGDDKISYLIEYDGQKYTQPFQLNTGTKSIKRHKITLKRFRKPNINSYKANTTSNAASIALPSTTYEIIQIDPERFDAEVQMHIIDPNTDHRTQVLLSDLLDSQSEPYRPVGGYIGNAHIEYTVNNSELTINTIRNCGKNVTALGKPITTMANEPRYLGQDNISEILSQNRFSALDGSCWSAPDDLAHGPESILLQPVVKFGRENLTATTQLHIGVAPDNKDWQTTVDVALGGFNFGTTLWGGQNPSLACEATWKDLRTEKANDHYFTNINQALMLPFNSLGMAFWFITLPYYPNGEWRSAFTGDLTGYVCTNSKNEPVTLSTTGAPEMDPAIDTFLPENLEVWAVPEPVWSGYGNTGTFIYGTHIEINGNAVDHTKFNGSGSLNTNIERIVSSFYKTDKPVKYRGQATVSGEFDNRLTVYACINSQAKCSPRTNVADEPSEVQQYGYVKVLDIPLTRENFGTN